MNGTAVVITPWPPDAQDQDAMVADTIALWAACGLTRPWNDAEADLRLALQCPTSTVLLARTGAQIAGSAMVGHDGHRGAVYYVAVAQQHRARGIGAALMSAAEEWLIARGVPKLNVMVRTENRAVTAFYEALGYGADDVVVLSKRFSPSQ